MVYNLLGLGGFKGGRYKSALAPDSSIISTKIVETERAMLFSMGGKNAPKKVKLA